MKPIVLTFCSLAELVDWTHADSPSQCAYIVRAGSPCKGWMNRGTSSQAKLVIEKYLDILIGPSETYAESIPQFEFLQELATIQLCTNHKKHHSHAIGQWLNEYTAQQVSIIARLTEYYNLGVDDISHGESEDSEDADDEQNTSEDTLEEEDISTISSQSSSSLTSTFVRHTSILAEDEVAKDVTWLLQQPIEKNPRSLAGYISYPLLECQETSKLAILLSTILSWNVL